MTKLSNYLEVVDIKESIDINHNKFKTLTFRNVVVSEGEVIASPLLCKLAVYKDSKHDLYYKKRGSRIVGKIVTRQVEPYAIGSKIVDTYTTAVFCDPNSSRFEEAVAITFQKRGKKLRQKRSNKQQHLVIG